jgi:hypothetical protein
VEICQEMLTRNIDLVSDDLFGECIERVKKSLDFEEESKKYFEDVLSQ